MLKQSWSCSSFFSPLRATLHKTMTYCVASWGERILAVVVVFSCAEHPGDTCVCVCAGMCVCVCVRVQACANRCTWVSTCAPRPLQQSHVCRNDIWHCTPLNLVLADHSLRDCRRELERWEADAERARRRQWPICKALGLAGSNPSLSLPSHAKLSLPETRLDEASAHSAC